MTKAYLNWSSGKDATFSLHKVVESGHFSVEKLVTSLNTDFNRVSMHGIRKELLERQAESLGIPLQIIPLAGNVSMEEYNAIMRQHTSQLKKEGFYVAVFGDILLEDLKEYREEQLKKIGLTGEFPLWKAKTSTLAKQFIDLGYKAIVVSVNAKLLDESFCGRMFDESFLSDLPKTVDPCGENGEFHTFVFDGPLFKKSVQFAVGEKVLRDFSENKDDENANDKPSSWDTKFWFVDLEA